MVRCRISESGRDQLAFQIERGGKAYADLRDNLNLNLKLPRGRHLEDTHTLFGAVLIVSSVELQNAALLQSENE